MSKEWYPCFIWTVMWKAESNEHPRIVIYRVANHLLHNIEEDLNNHPLAVKI